MYYKNINLRSHKEIEIVVFSDWHLGSRNFEDKLAKKFIDYVCDNENVYCISAGDLTNAALKNSKSDVYTSMNPKEEIELLCSDKFLGRIPKEKWLLLTSGNHGNRSTKEIGISFDEMIVDRLGVKDKYSSFLGAINVQLSNSSFYIALHHGSGGGGSTIGGKANRMNKIPKIITNLDISIIGHTHQQMQIPMGSYSIDKKHDKIQYLVTHLINSGSLHGYDGSYAEAMLLEPVVLGQAIIGISATSKQKKKVLCRWQI